MKSQRAPIARSRRWLAALALLLPSTGCFVQVPLAGKSCGEGHDCVDGYVCVDARCVDKSSAPLVDGGSRDGGDDPHDSGAPDAGHDAGTPVDGGHDGGSDAGSDAGSEADAGGGGAGGTIVMLTFALGGFTGYVEARGGDGANAGAGLGPGGGGGGGVVRAPTPPANVDVSGGAPGLADGDARGASAGQDGVFSPLF